MKQSLLTILEGLSRLNEGSLTVVKSHHNYLEFAQLGTSVSVDEISKLSIEEIGDVYVLFPKDLIAIKEKLLQALKDWRIDSSTISIPTLYGFHLISSSTINGKLTSDTLYSFNFVSTKNKFILWLLKFNSKTLRQLMK